MIFTMERKKKRVQKTTEGYLHRNTGPWKCSGFLGGSGDKEPPANAGDLRDAGSILGLGRSPGGGHGNPLQYSCLENPMNRRSWWATVHGVTKSWTQLKWLGTTHDK